MVGLCHFGPFESAVHAQNAGSSVSVYVQFAPCQESILRSLSFISRNQLLFLFILQMTIQSITNETSQQQLKELVDKLSSDFQMQGREYEKQLRSAQNYTKVLSDRLDQYQKDIKELDDKSPCNAKQLLNLDSKLNMTLSQRKIAFFAQRKSPYSTVGRIPFPINPLNEGNGFNSKTGEFAAPVDGIYHFYFSGWHFDYLCLLVLYLFGNKMHRLKDKRRNF